MVYSTFTTQIDGLAVRSQGHFPHGFNVSHLHVAVASVVHKAKKGREMLCRPGVRTWTWNHLVQDVKKRGQEFEDSGFGS